MNPMLCARCPGRGICPFSGATIDDDQPTGIGVVMTTMTVMEIGPVGIHKIGTVTILAIVGQSDFTEHRRPSPFQSVMDIIRGMRPGQYASDPFRNPLDDLFDDLAAMVMGGQRPTGPFGTSSWPISPLGEVHAH